jgi:uncharacterized protein with PQ loop repeat
VNAYIELVGFIASVMSFVLWWPQAALVWRCRARGEQLTGVSTSSQLLLLINACLWGVYAVGTGSLWVGAPGLVNGPLAIITIVLLRRARQGLQQSPAGMSPVHDVHAPR